MLKYFLFLYAISLCYAYTNEEFILSSSAFTNGSVIPEKYSYNNQNVNPPLSWDPSTLPEGTQSLVLIVDDPDAPSGLWTHWLVKDIPVTTSSIEEGSVPGTQVKNSWGTLEYGGMKPPSGTHRYFFKLYAMPTKTVEAQTAAELYNEVETKALGVAILMGRYSAASNGNTAKVQQFTVFMNKL